MYMDVMKRFRVGLGCTGRYMDIMEGFRVGLGCIGRYMDIMEWFRVVPGCRCATAQRAQCADGNMRKYEKT
jgi:hypothetical protein